jgi:hypothetical protein
MEYVIRWQHGSTDQVGSQADAKRLAREQAAAHRFFVSARIVYDSRARRDYATHRAAEMAKQHARELEAQAMAEGQS